ncbi:hypothetical protein ElyMa_003560900 [Elysia marginata]|uniref:Uncharacterized protein n=1 Tax=Elysia marginata TaxID=1093978 RepID=A0AAV4EMX5_9GAST|nr:hypothetical protein ElyMa_003560900 [Elysia marginata]
MNPLRCYRPTPSMAAKVGHQFHPPEGGGAIHRVQSTSALRIPRSKKTFWQRAVITMICTRQTSVGTLSPQGGGNVTVEKERKFDIFSYDIKGSRPHLF